MGVFPNKLGPHFGPRKRHKRRKATIQDIADFFGIARKTVYRRLKDYPEPLDMFDIQSVLRFVAREVLMTQLRKKPKVKASAA